MRLPKLSYVAPTEGGPGASVMTPRELILPILSQISLVSGYHRMTLRWDSGVLPSPGQFLLVSHLDGYDPLLPRPFTTFRAAQGSVEILYKIVGKGTRALSSMTKGEKLRVIGPLGKGYSVSPSIHRAVLVAGGMGIASLYSLCSVLLGRNIQFYFGAKTKDQLVERDGLKKLRGLSLHLATEDGSLGFRGIVTDLVKRDFQRLQSEGMGIYACGPAAMLKEIGSLAIRKKIPCQISLESQMACGVGVCLGCAIPCRKKDGKSYRLCCTDGPVFEAQDIIW